MWGLVSPVIDTHLIDLYGMRRCFGLGQYDWIQNLDNKKVMSCESMHIRLVLNHIDFNAKLGNLFMIICVG